MRGLLAALVLAAAAVGAVSASGASRQGPALVPPQVVTSFRAVLRAGALVETNSWRAPDSFAQRRQAQAAFVGDVVERGGARYFGAAGTSRGIVERRPFVARPDGHSFAATFLWPSEHVLAQARAGKLKLAAATVGGRPAWRARVALRANECAGLRAGTVDVWLDRRTLLPLRTLERRGGRAASPVEIRYPRLGTRLPATEFRRPRLGPRPQETDAGFRRGTPASAARSLPYVPLLPRALPRGFSLALSGWAPRSGRTGPEGSNPPSAHLFAAVYRRGVERVDVTQRVAGARGWLSDPFGAECEFQAEERASVRGVEARYGIGPNIVSHLHWREGNLLLTLSGPFPKADLVAIAESLAPVR
jgi:hypothetical protein